MIGVTRMGSTKGFAPGIVMAALALLAGFGGGCSDVVTFANRSREKGLEFYKQGDYTQAAGAFRNATKQDPRDYESHFYLGVCYTETGQHQQAFAQYRTARDVFNRYIAGQTDPAFGQMMLDAQASAVARHDSAEVELTRLEQRAQASQQGEDWFVVAKVYRLKGDADRAIDAYRRAAQWAANDFFIRKEYGLYLLDPLGQRREAEVALRQAYALNTGDEAVVAGLERLGVNVPLVREGTRIARPGSPASPASPTAVRPVSGRVVAPRD